MSNRLKKFLSSSWISTFCFVVALLAKLGLLRIFLDIGTDKAALILTTRNFLNGYGISVDRVGMTDLSQRFYDPFIGWPPGYNLLLSPFLVLFPGNFMLACYLLDATAAILFFVYLRKLLLHLNFPTWLANLFLLFQGLFINDYLSSSHPTDFLSLAFLLAGLFYTLKLVHTGYSGKQVYLSSFFFSWALLVRYQYIPVVFMVMIVLIILGMMQKRKSWQRSGMIVLCILLFVCGVVLIFQKLKSGSSVYLPLARKGFFPENVLFMYPFIPTAFINLDFYAMQLSLAFTSSYSHWIQWAKWINGPLFILLVAVFMGAVLKRKFNVANTRNAFWFIGSIAAFTNIGLLIFLSLFHDSHIGPPMFEWTYVMDGRYYAFPILFLQIVAWDWLFAGNIHSIFQKILRTLLIITVLVEMLHGAYFLVKKFSQGLVDFQQILWQQPEMVATKTFMDEQRQKEPERKVVVTSLDNQFGYIADWYGAAGLFTPLELNSQLPKSSTPALLLVAIREKELFLFNSFLKQPGVKLLQSVDNYHFYTLYVDPASTSN